MHKILFKEMERQKLFGLKLILTLILCLKYQKEKGQLFKKTLYLGI